MERVSNVQPAEYPADLHPNPDTVHVGANLLQNEIADVQNLASSAMLGAGASGFWQGVSPEGPVGGLASFMVYWDSGSSQWFFHDPQVVLPNGSVVTPPAAAISPGNTYWLHVVRNKDKSFVTMITTGENHGIENADGAWKVKIATIGGNDAPGCVTQHHLGAFSVPANSSAPGVFEPYFDDKGSVKEVGDGIYPFGRKFIHNADGSGIIGISSGFVVLEISHPEVGTLPSAKIVVKGEGLGEIISQERDKTILPLYVIKNGAIALDCRSCLSLAIRE